MVYVLAIHNPPKRKRNRPILLRLSPDELQAFNERLEAAHMKQNEFLLRCALAKPIIVMDGLPEIVAQLKGIGNNLNQLTRAVNGGRTNSAQEVAELAKAVNEVWRLLRQLTQAEIDRKH
jgi:hypothetical protein